MPSIKDLNSRLPSGKKPTDERNWRPNILTDGGNPYDEDKWQYIRINGNLLKATKPRTICRVPNVDPNDGTKDDEMSPLYVEYVNHCSTIT